MNKILVPVLLITYSVFLFSCKEKDNSQNNELRVLDVEIKHATSLKYDDYFNSYSLIPLETRENSLIGEISKLYVTDSHIIVFDKKSMNIMLFDINGKFVRQIGVKGAGPEEYIAFNDIQFEQETSLIYAHERFQNSIYIYDLSGKLINKSPQIEFDFNSFYKTKYGYWIYSCFKKNNSEGYNLSLLDLDFKDIIASYFPQKEFINVTDFPTFTCDENNIPYFFYPSSNVIYQLIDTHPSPFCLIDFGHRTMPYNKITDIKGFDEYDQLIANKKYLGNISNLNIRNGIAHFSFGETGFGIETKAFSCFFNISEDKVTVFENSFIEGIKFPVESKIIGAMDQTFIYQIDLSVCTKDSYIFLSEKLSIPIMFDSNPILVMLKLK